MQNKQAEEVKACLDSMNKVFAEAMDLMAQQRRLIVELRAENALLKRGVAGKSMEVADGMPKLR